MQGPSTDFIKFHVKNWFALILYSLQNRERFLLVRFLLHQNHNFICEQRIPFQEILFVS